MSVKHIIPLLDSLSNIYSRSSKFDSWSWLTAVTFSSLNRPEAVPTIFQHAMKDLTVHEEKLLLARKFRESIFKSGLTSGYPKAINSLIELNNVMPEELKEKSTLRDTDVSLSELAQIGQTVFERTYGSTADSVQNLLRDIYPDMELFSTAIGYGYVYSLPTALNAYETSFAMIVALIASEVPLQITWHLSGAIRNGATVEEVKVVREIALKIAEFCGVVWKTEIPEVPDSLVS